MIKYIVFIGLFLVSVSCSDFLEPKSQNEYVPENAVSLNEMLLGEAYARADYSNCLFSLQTILDDDVTCSTLPYPVYSGANNEEGYHALYSWQPDMFTTMENVGMYNDNSSNPWKAYYDLILGCNAALDYIDDVVGTDEEVALVKAQAHALRALYYFNLVNLFGEPYNHNKEALGVPLKLTSELTTDYPSRNTVEEVYEQIERDLDAAEEYYLALPEDMQYKQDFRTNLPMVQLLKSRVFLHMERWAEAAEYANRVITEWEFSLIDLNTLPTPTEREPYYNFISYDCSETIWLYGSTMDVTRYVTLVTQDDNDNTLWRHQFSASESLLNGYVTGDLRKEKYIVTEKEDPSIYLPWGKTYVSSEHLTNSTTEFGLAFRLAEAYLNLAEGAALSDDPVTARNAMNTLREKRFTPETYSPMPELTGDELVEFIRQERRLELCYEGFRWFDLRRYGMPSFSREWRLEGEFVALYTLAEDDPSYTLPIPEGVLEMNRNLVQNVLANPR